ncbi:hypothetical protein K470DRAFT_212841 [Piedraia hortae CBS 480.64]|uniref:Autophagy-related protein 3 n=1 Tax=Piedraia hortae CBS 480.64 TaxID=1314780 RepID=A0A6A7C4M4_9PEZI|nr:hypothetical protein K470DRAFT_212841 [Piedraia hortae CBS 480.64]
MQNLIHSFIDPLRDRFAPLSHHSTFRSTGEIMPDEFQAAGDYLVHRFPSWSWAEAATPAQRVNYFPPNKQYLITRAVPCRRRLKGLFLGNGDEEDQIVRDMLQGPNVKAGGVDDGWLKAGGIGKDMTGSADLRMRDVRTVEEDGTVGDGGVDEEYIPDMEDYEDDDEAVIKAAGANEGLRMYTLYITYTPYYRTPRMYLIGYDAATNQPLPPLSMMEDIVGDYKDKTVTLENFAFVNPPIKTVSIHPCRHASVMKILLDRADAALQLRMAKMRTEGKANQTSLDGLVDATDRMSLNQKAQPTQVGDKDKDGEWEVVDESDESEGAIRVDQYLVVFLKFMASVTPGIEYDYTMSI